MADAMAMGAEYTFEAQNVLKVLSRYVNVTTIQLGFVPRLSMTHSLLDDESHKLAYSFAMNP